MVGNVRSSYGHILMVLAITTTNPALSSSAPIDNFSTFQTPARDAVDDGIFVTHAQPGPLAGTIVPLGGSRQISVSKTNNAAGAVEAIIVPGAFLYDALGAVAGQLSIDYADLGGIDLSSFDTLVVSGFIDASAASSSGTTLGVLLEDGSVTSRISSFSLTVAGPFTEEIPLSDYAPVNLSDLARVSLGTFDESANFIDIPAGGDITLIQFEADTTAVVAEGSTWRLWLVVAIVSLAFKHRQCSRAGAIDHA